MMKETMNPIDAQPDLEMGIDIISKTYHKTVNKTAMKILLQLSESGALILKDLSYKLGFATKTVKYWSERLLALRLISKIPNLNDMRSEYFKLTKSGSTLVDYISFKITELPDFKTD